MAESALALREHPQIIELLSVLEQNSLSKQKEEVQALVGYIDGMEENLCPDGAQRGTPCGKSRRRKIFRKNRAAGAETGPGGAAPPGGQ